MDRRGILKEDNWKIEGGNLNGGKGGLSGHKKQYFLIFTLYAKLIKKMTQKSPFPPLSKNRDIYINIPTIHRRGRRQSITI